MNEPLFMDVTEAVKVSGLSRDAIYQLLHRQENPLPHRRSGTRYKIIRRTFESYIERHL